MSERTRGLTMLERKVSQSETARHERYSKSCKTTKNRSRRKVLRELSSHKKTKAILRKVLAKSGFTRENEGENGSENANQLRFGNISQDFSSSHATSPTGILRGTVSSFSCCLSLFHIG